MSTPTSPAYFHPESQSVRFSVLVDGQPMGATITRSTLHHRFRPTSVDEDPLETFAANVRLLEDAVRRRAAEGSLEPVMLREFDLREAG